MRKLKVVLLSVISLVIVAIFGTEVFAAAIMSFHISGSVEYYSQEISAEIWATKSFNDEGVQGDSSYLTITGSGTFDSGIYSISGSEPTYDDITADAGTVVFNSNVDELEFYVFIRNNGDRYILPRVDIESSDDEDFDFTTEYYYFDISASGQVNPYTVKANSATPTAFVSSIETEISNNRYSVWQSNSSIDNLDVLCIRIVVMLSPQSMGDSSSNFDIYIEFMADVQYSNSGILSVYQTINQADPTWTKFGYNATLNAAATKVETNSLSNLYTYLRDADEYGNANIDYATDDYVKFAPVYKDIDLVNIDINTGEIIGKLSDLNYDFEWYGRDITLTAGTELASGRTLSTTETFTVDVYTYFPTMYIRRWVVGDKMWLSLAENEFYGSVEIPEFYIATFVSTIFNPDKSIAHNSNDQIIPRSYVYDRCPVSEDSVSYLQTHYGYDSTSISGTTATAKQSQYIEWMENLSSEWQSSGLTSQYKEFSGVQGENWKMFIFNILMTIKYANNDMQSTVGMGSASSHAAYKNKSITDCNGATVSMSSGNNAYVEGTIGGGAIGVRTTVSNEINTATYDSSNNYKMSDTGYNKAGMNYGYNSTYTYGNHRQGLYLNQFLTYTTEDTRYVLDGYVGSNGYTSVFCLGLCNAWGNTWEWLFGSAALYDGSNVHAYVCFDDYDSSDATHSWMVTTNKNGYALNSAELVNNRNYIEMSYYLPKSTNYYRYLGTTIIKSNPLEMLVGLPSKNASTTTEGYGLCDFYFCTTSDTAVYGVARGGACNNDLRAGPFYFSVDNHVEHAHTRFTFRMLLVPTSS